MSISSSVTNCGSEKVSFPIFRLDIITIRSSGLNVYFEIHLLCLYWVFVCELDTARVIREKVASVEKRPPIGPAVGKPVENCLNKDASRSPPWPL